MQSLKRAVEPSPPIQLSLRIRHPVMDPAEISSVFRLPPAHYFKAGDYRSAVKGRPAGQHPQSYWLAPLPTDSLASLIEPTFLAEIAATMADRRSALSAEHLGSAARNALSQSAEGLLFYFLYRLRPHQSFLQRIQSEGGDVTLLMHVDRELAPDFTLPVSLARLLVQLGISIEFVFAP
jgi:hypothetical protein